MCRSRTKAKEHISEGRVKVNGTAVTKAGYEVCDGDTVEFDRPENEYVGRGAHKLEGALDAFSVDVSGKACIDVGASTGGFTQILLSRGAESVTAVDSGRGQLDPVLREDKRVRNVEGCNARYMTRDEVGDGYALAVMDVSFISQTYIFPALFPLLCEDGVLISLVKPQFELDSRSVGKGVVKNPDMRYKALLRVYESVLVFGYHVSDVAVSPICGGDGNIEYLFLIERGAERDAVRQKLRALASGKGI